MTQPAANTYKHTLQPGHRLGGDYVIDRVLGAGGFGITYKAFDEGLQAWVALKEFFPTGTAIREDGQTVHARSSAENADYAWGLERFKQEAQVLARFNHRNIVRVSRIFEENNTAYCVLDYIEGPKFSDWLRGLGRNPTQAELDHICASVLDALDLVHRNGLLHRDIAPDNILMRNDGTPVLIDFGAARQAMSNRSASMSAIYKRGFSPIEQYSTAADQQGPWSDIYSTSATFYYAVTGSIPVDALTRNMGEALPLAEIVADGLFRPDFLRAIDAGLGLLPKDRPRDIPMWRPMLLGDDAARAPIAGSDPATEPRATWGEPPGSGGKSAPRLTTGQTGGGRQNASGARKPKWSAGRIALLSGLVVAALGLAGGLAVVVMPEFASQLVGGSASQPAQVARSQDAVIGNDQRAGFTQPQAAARPVEPAAPARPAQPSEPQRPEQQSEPQRVVQPVQPPVKSVIAAGVYLGRLNFSGAQRDDLTCGSSQVEVNVDADGGFGDARVSWDYREPGRFTVWRGTISAADGMVDVRTVERVDGQGISQSRRAITGRASGPFNRNIVVEFEPCGSGTLVINRRR